MKELLKRYNEIRYELKNLEYACFVISFDNSTICPKKDKENSYDVENYFKNKILEITTSKEYYNLLKDLLEYKEELDEITYKIIKEDFTSLDKLANLDFAFLTKGNEIEAKTHLTWMQARETLDFSIFEENMQELVEYKKEYAKLVKSKYSGYDVLLDEMEDDFTTEQYDNFFNLLEKEILPIVKKRLKEKKRYNESIKDVKFSIDKQKLLSNRICQIMGYSFDVGSLAETVHPFSSHANINDVRITTTYSEDLLFSNLYSVMHEVGHALYTLGHNPLLNESSLMNGASCALHESQSRFYENYLGRSKEFITYLYPILKDIFKEELAPYSLTDIYEYINDVASQPTRTEADELTYPFHVLIRYKVEKKLFNNELLTKDIAPYFNSLLKEYFDIEVKDKKEGCFQDIHWCGGYGYFPTYALGSAFGAMFLDSLKQDLDVSSLLEKGDFLPINNWLKEHIHFYGGSLKNLEVIKKATNKDFDPTYYINYLKEKFDR